MLLIWIALYDPLVEMASTHGPFGTVAAMLHIVEDYRISRQATRMKADPALKSSIVEAKSGLNTMTF